MMKSISPNLLYLSFCVLMAAVSISAFYLVWTGKLRRRFHNEVIVGAMTGAITALGYLCIWEVIFTFDSGMNRTHSNWLSVVEIAVVVAIHGVIIGLLPAAIVGSLTGWLYQFTRKKMSAQMHPSVLMLLICILFALLIHGAAFMWLQLAVTDFLTSFPRGAYLSTLGLPTLLYVIVGIRTAYHQPIANLTPGEIL